MLLLVHIELKEVMKNLKIPIIDLFAAPDGLEESFISCDCESIAHVKMKKFA